VPAGPAVPNSWEAVQVTCNVASSPALKSSARKTRVGGHQKRVGACAASAHMCSTNKHMQPLTPCVRITMLCYATVFLVFMPTCTLFPNTRTCLYCLAANRLHVCNDCKTPKTHQLVWEVMFQRWK
jgi:hypothetical protein